MLERNGGGGRGWHMTPGLRLDTFAPAVRIVSGIVHLRGAMSNSGGNFVFEPFVLPPALRPSHILTVPVDLCNATNGSLSIDPDGFVEVDTEESGNLSSASCFTSLDGVSYSR